MIYSVLHIGKKYDNNNCGVYCRESDSYVFYGTVSECFEWKASKDAAEQAQANNEWLQENKEKINYQ